MFRFTIRDVLWLMVVVGVALTLWLGWSRHAARLREEYAANVAAGRQTMLKAVTDLQVELAKEKVRAKTDQARADRQERSLKHQPGN